MMPRRGPAASSPYAPPCARSNRYASPRRLLTAQMAIDRSNPIAPPEPLHGPMRLEARRRLSPRDPVGAPWEITGKAPVAATLCAHSWLPLDEPRSPLSPRRAAQLILRGPQSGPRKTQDPERDRTQQGPSQTRRREASLER